MGWFSSTPPKGKAAAKTEKCPTCKKSVLACSGHRDKGAPVKVRVKVEDKYGRHTVRDGVTWCGTCSCRRINDSCTNAGCSTNKGGG